MRSWIVVAVGVAVVSGSGQLLQSWNLKQGSAYAVLDVAFLPSGFYTLQYKNGPVQAYLKLPNLKI